MSVTLSKRLACIASYVKRGSRVVDVGTDHGYIPAWLIENGASPFVIASDINEGPLKRAQMTARNAGIYNSINFVLCPGLEKCPPDAVDTVIIAGMGGETIISILEAAPWAKEKELIIQPQSKIPELKKWLCENAYAINDAQLVSDTGRIYLVWSVSAGVMDSVSIIDKHLIERKEPLLLTYLDGEIKKKLKICKGMEHSSACSPEALEKSKAELQELKRIREEAEKWQK